MSQPNDEMRALDDKCEQGNVLYFTAASIDRKSGARCGACWKFILGGKCVEVAGDIKASKVCGLYVHGKPFDRMPNFIVTQVSKAEAGYGDGDTHCADCEYFKGPGRCEKVKNTPNRIEAGGCCNEFDRESK